MAFTNDKRWLADFRAFPTAHRKPTIASMTAWPTSSAANFSRLSPEPGVKMIITPKVFYATYDTMPPPNQVIMLTSTHSVIKDHNQVANLKTSGKRENVDGDSSPRPPKQHRPCD
ncbi:putative DET1-and DDB1-associated protein [Plasmopara halstedii]